MILVKGSQKIQDKIHGRILVTCITLRDDKLSYAHVLVMFRNNVVHSNIGNINKIKCWTLLLGNKKRNQKDNSRVCDF